MEQARLLLEDPAQGVLDVAVEPSAPVAPLLEERGDGALLPPPATQPPVGRDGRGRVVGTDSRVLFDALAGVYAGLGFDGLGDGVFRDLVICRVVEPTSLLDAARVLSDLGHKPAGYATMKRTLSRAGVRGYRDRVAEACFEHASTSGDVSLILYDVTTLFCRHRHNNVYADLLVMPTSEVSVQVRALLVA